MPNDSYQPDAPPAWLATADASPDSFRLDLTLPADRYRQLLDLAGGDAAQALRLAAELLSEAIVELARERQELAEALAMMKGA